MLGELGWRVEPFAAQPALVRVEVHVVILYVASAIARTALMDARKRQWMAMDPGYYSNRVTVKLFARFGSAGVIVFDAFLRACKHSFIEGQISYANPDQLLNMLGLPPTFELVDNMGEKWELDELWRVLGDHHMTARRRHDDRTTIVARRWDDWQKRRSPARNTDTKKRLTKTKTKTATKTTLSSTNGSSSELPPGLWMKVAQEKLKLQPPGAVSNPEAWLQSAAQNAERNMTERACSLHEQFDVSTSQLACALATGTTGPTWNSYRRNAS